MLTVSFRNSNVFNLTTFSFLAFKHKIVLAQCLANNKFNEKWEYNKDNQIRHTRLNMCLNHRGLTVLDSVYATKCDPSDEAQKWDFSK